MQCETQHCGLAVCKGKQLEGQRLGQGMSTFGLTCVRGTLSVMSFDGYTVGYAWVRSRSSLAAASSTKVQSA